MNNNLSSTNCWANNKLLKKDNTITLIIKEKQNITSLDFDPSNPKVKFLPLSSPIKDKNLEYLLDKLTHYEEKKKHNDFQKWLHQNSNNTLIKNILNQMMKNIMLLIKTKGFTITEQNILRNKIATLIYTLSSCQAKKNEKCNKTNLKII